MWRLQRAPQAKWPPRVSAAKAVARKRIASDSHRNIIRHVSMKIVCCATPFGCRPRAAPSFVWASPQPQPQPPPPRPPHEQESLTLSGPARHAPKFIHQPNMVLRKASAPTKCAPGAITPSGPTTELGVRKRVYLSSAWGKRARFAQTLILFAKHH